MGVFLLLLLYVKFDKYKYRCYLLLQMTANFTDFINDMQSINLFEKQALVLFCDTSNRARAIQQSLQCDFGIHAITDIDNNGFNYIIPLQDIDDKTLSKFIYNGWNWDKSQNFIQYTITFYNTNSTTKMYNMLIANGYNVQKLPNNMQLVACCLDNSPHSDKIQNLRTELITMQKSHPMSMDDYFNKIIFNGKIENTEYRNMRKQEFTVDYIEQNYDPIICGILYQYFNKRIRTYLGNRTFPKKFDANKMDKKLKQRIDLVRDFLYDETYKYIHMQSINASNTKHNVFVRFDYLKSCNDYKNVGDVIKKARQWRRTEDTLAKNSEKNRRESDRGVYKIMDVNDGLYVVQLFSPQSLDYEGSMLNHCVGDGYYDNQVYLKSVQIYSIRDARGYPYLTIEVNNGKISQCYGYNNRVPNDPKLRTAVRTLMRAQNLDIDTWNPLIAYTKQNNILYDVFNLPENFVLNHSIDLCGMGLEKLPNMSTVTVNSDFLCSTNKLTDLTGAPNTVKNEVKCSCNPLKSLRGMPRNIGGKIYLSETQLTTKSFVPLYMENKLDDIIGVDDNLIAAWRKQIANRKTEIANIIMTLKNHAKE